MDLLRLCALAAILSPATSASPTAASPNFFLSGLRTEYMPNPLGVEKLHPRFAWELVAIDPAASRGLKQVSYQITLTTEGGDLVWSSGKVSSSTSFQVPYAGTTALVSNTVYTWEVEVTAVREGSSSASSAKGSATFSTGMIPGDSSAWKAGGKFVSSSCKDAGAAPWFRKSFDVPEASMAAAAGASSLLYVASNGGYNEVYVNGEKASEAVLTPVTSFLPKRVLYNVYNVTHLLRRGEKNAIGVWAGQGWSTYYEGTSNVDPHGTYLPYVYAGPAVLVELYDHASGFTLASDPTWKSQCSTTTHLNAGSFGGDAVNASKDVPGGWDAPGLDDSEWPATSVVGIGHAVLTADIMEPTLRHSTVAAKRVNSTQGAQAAPSTTTYVVEMDELFTGWFEVDNLKGAPGSTVTFSVSTTLGKPVEFGMQDSFTFGPSGTGKFVMRFSYHEILYITVAGLSAPPLASDVTGVRLTSLGARTGDFSCSSELISKMYDVTVNNYRGLTTGGMTVDCPHRERRGYGGDGHTSYQFALANFPVGAYFTKWQRDFADAQEDSGWVPHTAPTFSGGGGPAWSGYVVTNPWQTYNTYGDKDILAQMFPTMQKLLEFYAQRTSNQTGLLEPWSTSQWDFLGDWITPHGSENVPRSPETVLFNNAYLRYITALAAEIAGILGDEAAAAKYRADADSIGAAVVKAFAQNSSTGVFLDKLQTHAAMPLAAGLVPADLEPKTAAVLEDAILHNPAHPGHVDTGLTGTYFMTKYLMESGRNDLVFSYANKTTFPSYGWFLEQGFTTWPEEWDTKGQGFSWGGSKMHGCYNAIGVWFVEGVAGIRVHFSEELPVTIRAGVEAGDIHWARGERYALTGQARSSWRVATDGAVAAGSAFSFQHNVTIPANGVARVLIPVHDSAREVMESSTTAAAAPGVTPLDDGGTETINGIKYAAFRVAAGLYRFSSQFKK